MSRDRNGPGTGPLLQALLAAALFGAATPASKALLAGVTPFQLAGLLYLGAAVAVLPFVIRNRLPARASRLPRRTLLQLLGAVACGGLAGPVLLLFALRMASSASVALWLNLELVCTILLGILIFRDPLTTRGAIAGAGTLAAAVLLSVSEGTAGVWAGLLLFAACLCWGVDNHLTAMIDRLSPAQTTFWKGSIAGSVNLAIGTIASPWTVPTATIAFGLVVGALSYGLSITLYIAAAQRLGATRSQIVFSSAPFFGVLLSALALGESISLLQSLAVVLLVPSIAVLTAENHAHRHGHAAVSHDHWHRHDDDHHDHDHAEIEARAGHSHAHSHSPVTHSHPHWPDLHHRHEHERDGGDSR